MNQFVYFFACVVLTCGLYIMLISDNYMRKILGLGLFQNGVLIFYISLSKKSEGVVPLEHCKNMGETCSTIISSPLPHVLMLTAIVVGFATLSVGLALIHQIKTKFGTVMESEVNEQINLQED